MERIEIEARRMRLAIESMPREAMPITLRQFPKGACGDSSLLLAEHLRDLALGEFQYVLAQRGNPDEPTWTWHTWLQRGDLILDITADQFADAPAGVIVQLGSTWHATFSRDHERPARLRDWHGPSVHELWRFYARLRAHLSTHSAQ